MILQLFLMNGTKGKKGRGGDSGRPAIDKDKEGVLFLF